MFKRNRDKMSLLDVMMARIEQEMMMYRTDPETPTINITEQRAPTDESIRLAEEMRNKALNSILYLESSGNNIFDYAFCITSADGLSCKAKLTAVINGKRYEVERFPRELLKQDYVEEENLEGFKVSRKKYSDLRLGELRIGMLIELFVKAMLDKNDDNFRVMINKLAIEV